MGWGTLQPPPRKQANPRYDVRNVTWYHPMRKLYAVLFGLSLCFAAHATVKPGDVPPDALGTTTDGQPLGLSSFHGKVVVVSFWATWCGYCMKEMPILAGLQIQANEHQLPLQVISIDSKESHSTFITSAKMIRKRLPNLVLSWDRDGRIGEPYGAGKVIPVMVMLHKDGTVAHIHAGYGESMLDDLLSEIAELLNEPAPRQSAAAAMPLQERPVAAH